MAADVLVPPLGQTVDTVTLVTWYKREGEAVTQGEKLYAIETDKATLDIEAPASGILRHITAQPGQKVRVLTPIARILAPGEEGEVAPAPAAPPAPPAGAAVPPAPAPAPAVQPPTAPPVGRIFISPRARRLAEEHRVPWQTLQGTGPQGAIVERDVRAYLEARAAVKTPTVSVGPAAVVMQAVPLEGPRAVIAQRMLESRQTTAPVTLMAEADAAALVELRRQFQEAGIPVSYNDIFLYIAGRALRQFPRLNASLEGDTIRLWDEVHIGLAVDTERGLLVPVVRDADRKRLADIARETQRLIERARAGQLTPEEMSGGTFTITNLGMYDVDAFTPIINLPQCAVLGIGRIVERPAVFQGAIAVRHRVWLSLTFDHRLLDGAPAAQFLQRIIQWVEMPHLLLI
ncbi:MAG: dihydrolipoamide acetyltransferase family protein [Anaerolineae bacterium]